MPCQKVYSCISIPTIPFASSHKTHDTAHFFFLPGKKIAIFFCNLKLIAYICSDKQPRLRVNRSVALLQSPPRGQCGRAIRTAKHHPMPACADILRKAFICALFLGVLKSGSFYLGQEHSNDRCPWVDYIHAYIHISPIRGAMCYTYNIISQAWALRCSFYQGRALPEPQYAGRVTGLPAFFILNLKPNLGVIGDRINSCVITCRF